MSSIGKLRYLVVASVLIWSPVAVAEVEKAAEVDERELEARAEEAEMRQLEAEERLKEAQARLEEAAREVAERGEPHIAALASDLAAEVYGLDYEGQIAAAKALRQTFASTPDIVDVDDSVEFPSEKGVVLVDRAKAARLGVPQSAVVDALGIDRFAAPRVERAAGRERAGADGDLVGGQRRQRLAVVEHARRRSGGRSARTGSTRLRSAARRSRFRTRL